MQFMMKIVSRCKEGIAKVAAIEDTPHAVALGAAIGILFGITPLFGIKMPLAVAISFVLRGNILATLIIVGIADLLVPVLAAVYFIEYKIGCFLFALKAHAASIDLIDDRGQVPHWIAIVRMGLPLLAGSIVLGVVAAMPAYIAVKAVLSHKKGGE